MSNEKITKADRSRYVRDNDYGNIQSKGLQQLDEPVMSEIEYSPDNEMIFGDYSDLDSFLETVFIPNHILSRRDKKLVNFFYQLD